MDAVATALKHLGGALFACLMLCLALLPTADAMVCSSDATVAAGVLSQVGEQAVASSHDHGGETHRDNGGDACVHGHCHQAATPAAPVAVELATIGGSAIALTPAETGLPPSRAPDGPMEPPRA